MPKYAIHLVTIFHPEVFTRLAKLGEPQTLPFWKRSRAALDMRKDRFASERGLKGTRRLQAGGLVTIDYGDPARGVRGKCINGAVLWPIWYEPRLVYTPDEPRPRPRWKIEFRNDWETDEGKLAAAELAALREAITSGDLKVNAVWLNKAYLDAPSRADTEVNLTLGPFPREEPKQFVDLRISAENERVWIAWEN